MSQPYRDHQGAIELLTASRFLTVAVRLVGILTRTSTTVDLVLGRRAAVAERRLMR